MGSEIRPTEGGSFLPPMAFRVTENGMAPQGLKNKGYSI